MKIRCGSHQQNRSIVRPGLSLMATKVALTAEEFRENSQRSIDLFNTEKLSTDSTHVLKSAYCILCISAVAICTERVEAKRVVLRFQAQTGVLQSARSVWRQSTYSGGAPAAGVVAICTERVEAKHCLRRRSSCRSVAICTERVEAKLTTAYLFTKQQVVAICTERVEAKVLESPFQTDDQTLQSARSVWRQRSRQHKRQKSPCVAICTERVEAKFFTFTF